MTDSGADSFVPLPGSARGPVPAAEQAGPVDESQRIVVTLVTRRRSPLPRDLVDTPETVTREQLAEQHGTDPADIDFLRIVLAQYGLQVTEADPGARQVKVEGSLAALSEAFGAQLSLVRSTAPGSDQPTEHRYRQGELRIPAELNGIVLAVLGLDDRPQARAHFRRAPSATAEAAGTGAAAPAAAPVSYTAAAGGRAVQVPGRHRRHRPARWPSSSWAAASPQRPGHLLRRPRPARALGHRGRRGRRGQRGRPGPERRRRRGAARHRGRRLGRARRGPGRCTSRPTPTRASSTRSPPRCTPPRRPPRSASAGASPRTRWTAQAPHRAGRGVRRRRRAGRHGDRGRRRQRQQRRRSPTASRTSTSRRPARTRWPAAAPACTATRPPARSARRRCGTTAPAAARPAAGSATRSRCRLAGVGRRAGRGRGGAAPARGVPDVAGDADPQTGYQVLVDGQSTVIGGTSAVAPLWAALICRLAQSAGQAVRAAPARAVRRASEPARPPPGFQDITSGNNGAYEAGPGWDACTGLGSPDGTALLGILSAALASPPHPARDHD